MGIKEEEKEQTRGRENGESLHLHLHKQALLKHVDTYKALKRDRTSLSKNRCPFFSLFLPNRSILRGGVSIFGFSFSSANFQHFPLLFMVP